MTTHNDALRQFQAVSIHQPHSRLIQCMREVLCQVEKVKDIPHSVCVCVCVCMSPPLYLTLNRLLLLLTKKLTPIRNNFASTWEEKKVFVGFSPGLA